MEKNNSTSPLVSEASRNTEGQGINRRKLKEWDETTPIFPFIVFSLLVALQQHACFEFAKLETFHLRFNIFYRFSFHSLSLRSGHFIP